MKILYIAQECCAAQVAARALSRIAPNLSLSWASSPEAAIGWIRDNRDAQAVIAETGREDPAFDALLEQVRDIGVTTPVAAVAPEHLDALSVALEANMGFERDAALSRTNRVCIGLQEQLFELEAALHEAGARQAAQTAATEQLARREAELSAAVAEATVVRVGLERRLDDAETARALVHQRAAEELAAAGERYTVAEGRLAQETALRGALEDHLAAAQTAREDDNRMHAAEVASLTTRLGEREAQHETSLARINRICAGLQLRLLELETAMHGADERHAADTAAIEQLIVREAQASAALADAIAAHSTLAQAMAEQEAAYQRGVADLTLARQRCSAFEAQVTRESTARSILEERLAASEGARHDADQQHATELTSLGARFADIEAQYAAALSQQAVLDRQRRDSDAALEDARRQWQSEGAALTGRLQQREAELGATLADALAGRAEVEHRLADAAAAHQQAEQRSTAELADAARTIAAFEARLGEEVGARATLEERLAAAQSARQEAERHQTIVDERLAAAERARHDADQQYATELASLAARLADIEAQYAEALLQHAALDRQRRESDVALEDVRREWQSEVAALTFRLQQRETELGATLADALAGRAEVENRLAATAAAHQEAELRSAAQLADAARTIAAFEVRLGEEVGGRAALEARLVAAMSARQEAEREQAIEIAAVSDRLAALQAQHEAAVRERADLKRELAVAAATFEQARGAWLSDISEAATLQAVLERQLEAGGRDNARLQTDADSLRRQMDVLRMRADTLRRHAAQVPALQVQLERSQKENRRQFERAPYGLFECGRDGSITRVNHSLAMLLGYRTATALQDVDVAETVFESTADLRWLLDRALQTGQVESLETTLTARDLHRLSVRLHAHSQDGWVTIAVEDLTTLREAEHRLREAQRLEAVGRVASEVATTCDTLLRDVSQEGREWLAALEDDAPLRQQGELLLGDVTRASGLLRQFVVYGHQQINNVGSVNLVRALRDMAPILKRVLGDDIALLLPKTMGRLEVDVDAERVERILVNVANYARERMPHGGRVKIRLATVTVDHQFVASHPKVRPGAHVLITIEEIKGPVWPPLPIHLPVGRPTHHDVTPTPPDRPGIDLGPLVALIGEVGGHLWMSAEPAGNVTLQVHLPKRTEQESLHPLAAVSGRARQFTRWFRH